ncbi:MAG: response regulator, partial [Cyanobacteria bacterium P01_A01_bin.84]
YKKFIIEMNLNTSLIINKPKKLIIWCLNHLNVNQKIIFGYTIALGISITGVTIGRFIGDSWEKKAIDIQKHALSKTITLHNLQTGVLQVRTHQQQLIPLTKQPEDFQKKYAYIVEHSRNITDNWSKIKYLVVESVHTKEEQLILLNLLEKYHKVPKIYLQELDDIVQRINIKSLKSETKIREAQNLLLDFTNSSIAISFDSISDELNDILKTFKSESEIAENNLIQALRLSNWIIFVSLSFSIAIAAFFASQISRGISNPILQLDNFARKVTGEENFDQQIAINTKDEIGTLASSFNQLVFQVKQLLQEQKESTAHLRAIIDNLADGLLVSDINGNIINSNPVITRMFCLGDVELTGINCHEFMPEIVELLTQSQQNPQTIFTTELELTKYKIGHASVTGIVEIVSEHDSESNSEKLAPKYIGSVILIRDITQEKEIDQMKTDFISTVSHELRTPLTSVLGFASIIQEKLEADVFPLLPIENRKSKKTIRRVRDNINIIISEAERLTALINDVLDIAKMEAGKLEWKKESIQVEKLIERSLLVTSSLFSDHNLELIVDIESGLSEIIGDRDRLMQVVINLISNAVKFTDRGSITCQARKLDNHIVVSIIDTGAGITSEDRAKVFEKFQQVGETLTDKPKGTGLGLPICQQIIEHHGGDIWVESQIGKGSNFSFSLPLTKRDSISELEKIINLDSLMRQLKEHSTQSIPTCSLDQKTILVVDDDSNIRELLRQSLEPQGYIVNQACNGLDAIKQIKLVKPDLIILDVMMPQINGFDVAAILKNNPETMDIPIIMLSIVEDKERGYRLGIDRYMTKPINSDSLMTEISSLLCQGTSTKKVLVVDKNASALLTLSEVLQTQGYNVVEASNGEECIEKALSLKPDMIIVDSGLSQQYDLIKTLRFEKKMENFCFILLGDDEKEGLIIQEM